MVTFGPMLSKFRENKYGTLAIARHSEGVIVQWMAEKPEGESAGYPGNNE
jgi:hypothetical protein